MHHSMTGFASGQGRSGSYVWTWDLRSVNAKGLDLRLRVPEWVPGLEAALKARLSQDVARGNVTLNLRLTREETTTALVVNSDMLDNVLAALAAVEERAMMQGISLAPSRAADVLSLRGVLENASPTDESDALAKALITDFEGVATSFIAMRAHEGEALSTLLSNHFDRISALVVQASQVLDTRRDAMKDSLTAQLRRVVEAEVGIDQQRLAQELAVLAVKADVTEELDRLNAHVAAARDLMTSDGPVGRKLDFLAQEFNREANTLCAKSQNAELTAVGLELKAVIEQMREQVQNLE